MPCARCSTAPADSLVGSLNLREVTDWVATEGGPYAVRDLAEELAVDLAEAFAALAAVERRSALSVLDGWFHGFGALREHGTRRQGRPS